ncbi:MAG: hypothetical protein JWQ87_4812 [Candidatus Sulfotelmatobacter sp.]|nr:hypothetical protein [Candidatus Sulfotelmatobacter sp.]
MGVGLLCNLMIGTRGPVTTAFDHEESLTHEEILLRFNKILGRNMTPEEKHRFFLPAEPPHDSDEESQNPHNALI